MEATLKLTGYYRRYYLTWAAFICPSCRLSDLTSLRPCCTKPSTFDFVSLKACVGLLNDELGWRDWAQQDLEEHGMRFVDERDSELPFYFPFFDAGEDESDAEDDEYFQNPFNAEEAQFIFVRRHEFEEYCVEKL